MELNLKKLVEYNKSLKEINWEILFEKLQKETEDSQYHRFVSKNEKLENECKDKMKLIQMRIAELILSLKEVALL